MNRCPILIVVAVLAGCDAKLTQPEAESCITQYGPVRAGFYAYFAPVSYSADPDPRSMGFATHLGFEADLLTALEAMDGQHGWLSRRPVAEWPDIWLLPSTPEFDMVGGGITILESRTLDATGNQIIAFTSGHIAFRQSLLVRAGDAGRLSSYSDLSSEWQVGVLRATTGEARLLQITRITNSVGVLAPGTRIETLRDTLVADGSANYSITPAGASATLVDRMRIYPASPAAPQVVYLGDVTGEDELVSALHSAAIDAVARGEIGNGEAAHVSDGALVVAVVDSVAEYGGFALDVDNEALLECIDSRLEWLTDRRRIGYAAWRADRAVSPAGDDLGRPARF